MIRPPRRNGRPGAPPSPASAGTWDQTAEPATLSSGAQGYAPRPPPARELSLQVVRERHGLQARDQLERGFELRLGLGQLTDRARHVDVVQAAELRLQRRREVREARFRGVQRLLLDAQGRSDRADLPAARLKVGAGTAAPFPQSAFRRRLFVVSVL